MTLTDEEIAKLQSLPGGIFTVAQVRAIAGDTNDPPRRVCVYPEFDPGNPDLMRFYDAPDEVVQYQHGETIDLIPHANTGSAQHGPQCGCHICSPHIGPDGYDT